MSAASPRVLISSERGPSAATAARLRTLGGASAKPKPEWPPARIVQLAAALGALACAACQAPTALYHWNGYDEALYAHYRTPQDREAYVAALRATIDGARERGERVPPGLYAEYGYALYEEGRAPEAIPWFELEARDWPESRLLMQKMIRNARLRGAPPPGAPAPAGPAGALEERT